MRARDDDGRVDAAGRRRGRQHQTQFGETRFRRGHCVMIVGHARSHGRCAGWIAETAGKFAGSRSVRRLRDPRSWSPLGSRGVRPPSIPSTHCRNTLGLWWCDKFDYGSIGVYSRFAFLILRVIDPARPRPPNVPRPQEKNHREKAAHFRRSVFVRAGRGPCVCAVAGDHRRDQRPRHRRAGRRAARRDRDGHQQRHRLHPVGRHQR